MASGGEPSFGHPNVGGLINDCEPQPGTADQGLWPSSDTRHVSASVRRLQWLPMPRLEGVLLESIVSRMRVQPSPDTAVLCPRPCCAGGSCSCCTGGSCDLRGSSGLRAQSCEIDRDAHLVIRCPWLGNEVVAAVPTFRIVVTKNLLMPHGPVRAQCPCRNARRFHVGDHRIHGAGHA
jgi:hypothetical protein